MNTRNKRASAIGLGLAALVVLPAPDTAISLPDRQQVTACYAGLSAQVLATYDAIEFTDVTLSASTLTSVTLSAATLASVTLEPD